VSETGKGPRHRHGRGKGLSVEKHESTEKKGEREGKSGGASRVKINVSKLFRGGSGGARGTKEKMSLVVE